MQVLRQFLAEWNAWLGPPKEVTCKECQNTFTAPENSNAATCQVCPHCWYKPLTNA